ncbi:hypothetical protein [Streptomyces sp. NRRL S-15]|uniref:hypothetical protein n=1 Tax=Streptomyces sp. NRRL S-15 TaxID=1463886 RepID=UPI0004C619D8|nr:hypothetical protein [Streptomyces sp. NRRL S-15]
MSNEGYQLGATDPARRLINEAFAIERPTSFRDDTPLPVVGAAPPVAQPGRPPMSQKATDASALMLAGGAMTVMVGGGASLVMLASGYADPTVCAIILGGPAVLVLAVSRLARRAKEVVEAAPAPQHHHYSGDVTIDQRSINSQTRGVIANTRNQG